MLLRPMEQPIGVIVPEALAMRQRSAFIQAKTWAVMAMEALLSRVILHFQND